VDIPITNYTNKTNPTITFRDGYLFGESNILLQNSLLLTIRYGNQNSDYSNSTVPIRVYQDIDHDNILTSQNFTNLQILNKK